MTEAVPTPRRSPDARALIGAGEAALSATRGLDAQAPDGITDTGTPAGTILPKMRAAILDTVVECKLTACPNMPEDEAETSEPAAPATNPPAPDANSPMGEIWQLVARAQDGDSEAFDGIYRTYADTVFKFAYRRTGNRVVAEDLTAETFLRGFRRIRNVAWQGNDLGAWLITIVRNLVADHFKSGRYRLEVATGQVLDADTEDNTTEGRPEIAVLDQITSTTLLIAIKKLNPEQQECIVLRFLQGFSVAETAAVMGKNTGAIKALQYRATRALRRLLPEGFEP